MTLGRFLAEHPVLGYSDYPLFSVSRPAPMKEELEIA